MLTGRVHSGLKFVKRREKPEFINKVFLSSCTLVFQHLSDKKKNCQIVSTKKKKKKKKKSVRLFQQVFIIFLSRKSCPSHAAEGRD